MSWESTDIYYQEINRLIKYRLGGLHSAQIILYSVNFEEIEQLQRNAQWDKAGEILAAIAMKLEKAGADAIALCTNTMHKVADQIEQAIQVPFLHIADSTIKHIQMQKYSKIGLLGTAFTMEQDFYKANFFDAGIEVFIPNEIDRRIVHDVIYQELCKGVLNASSKEKYQIIMNKLEAYGAEALILGCTEIGLLIQDHDLPLLDTTKLHIQDIVDFILQ